MLSSSAMFYSYHTLGSVLGKVTAPVLRKQGFQEAKIFHDWALIVGDGLAAESYPEKLLTSQKSLRIVVAHGAALEFQYLIPTLMGRINDYFGGNVVHAITLRQGHVVRGAKQLPTPKFQIPEADLALLVQQVTAVLPVPDLHEALLDLGKAIRGRELSPQ